MGTTVVSTKDNRVSSSFHNKPTSQELRQVTIPTHGPMSEGG